MRPDFVLVSLPVHGITRFVLPAALVFLAALAMIVGFMHVNPPTIDGHRFHRAALGLGVVVALVVAVTGAYPLLAPVGALLTLALAQTVTPADGWVRTPSRQGLVVAGVLLGVAVGVEVLFYARSPGQSVIGQALRVVALGAPCVALVGVGGALGRGRRPYGWVGLATLAFGALPVLVVDLASQPGGMGLVQFFLPVFGLCYAVLGVFPILLGYAGTAMAAEPSIETATTA